MFEQDVLMVSWNLGAAEEFENDGGVSAGSELVAISAGDLYF